MEYPNWFNHTAKANFEKFLTKKDGSVALQLGVYTGDASLWMLQNIPNLKLTDVDTWQGSDEEEHLCKAECVFDGRRAAVSESGYDVGSARLIGITERLHVYTRLQHAIEFADDAGLASISQLLRSPLEALR
jgi:hypothetical protein